MSYNDGRFPKTILLALGLNPNAHLPANGVAPRFIDGVKVWIDPLELFSGHRRCRHRVMCACPHCGRHMSAARLFQHKCGSKIRKRRPAIYAEYGGDSRVAQALGGAVGYDNEPT